MPIKTKESRIHFACTDEEKELYVRCAEERGLLISEWMRAACAHYARYSHAKKPPADGDA